MLKIASLTLSMAILCTPAAALAANVYPYIPVVDDVNFGVHPWVARNRYDDATVPLRRSEWYYYSHPDRSQTHALHPVFRANYYTPIIDTDYLRYVGRLNLAERYTHFNAYVPQAGGPTCDNYSYAQPNYRVPPYEYACQ